MSLTQSSGIDIDYILHFPLLEIYRTHSPKSTFPAKPYGLKIKKASLRRLTEIKNKISYQVRAFASLTTIFLPSNSESFNALIAFWASVEFSISTKPKPLDLPVSRSVIIFAETTVPCASNVCCNVLSLTDQGREPTNNLVLT